MIENSESLDYMFIRTFGEDVIDTGTEFPFIALDFLKHAYPEIEKYAGQIYAEDKMDHWALEEGFRFKILNMMLAAARQGNIYAIEMLNRMYKVYYKREYNQLKRFRTISADELYSFENDEEMFATTAARILTICPFMGIEISPECESVIPDVEDALNDKILEFRIDPESFSFDPDLFKEAGEEARELINRQKMKDKELYWRNSISKFKTEVFRYQALRPDFDLICAKERETMERRFTVTIALLKKRFRDRSFSDEEILFYDAIYELIKDFSDQIGYFDEMMDMAFGRTDKFSFEIERCRYHPEKQKVAVSAAFANEKMQRAGLAAKQDRTEEKPGNRIASSDNEKEYLREISDLKAELKLKQRNLDDLKLRYLEAKETIRQNKLDEESWSADREELVRLREYVYSITEEDIVTDTVSIQEMEKDLKKKKIIIVGGHDNWVGYLREKFPDWTYVKPSISGTISETPALNAEYLFFFTDTISHGSFNKYMNLVRRYAIPYSYLHGTNIERTISSIYWEVNKGRQ